MTLPPTPLTSSLVILAVCVVCAFLAGLLTRNYSHVDRLWSVLPPVYALVWLPDYLHDPRYLLAAALVLAWGIRLTTNFALKGGYAFSWRRGGFYEEDYRWAVLRARIPHRVAFELFNFFFISVFQLALVYAITLPLYYLGQQTAPLTAGDFALLALMAGFFVLETVADLQQLAYYKRRAQPAYADDPRVQLGFNTYGLWRFSRHPNYVGETGQWITLYLLLYHASGAHHPSGFGALTLVLLFVGSTLMAESITASKYPAYAERKRATSIWLPFDLVLRRRARRDFWAALSKAARSEDGGGPGLEARSSAEPTD